MGVYDPDMRIMVRHPETNTYVSHVSYKTERGAQALCAKLKRRKPKVAYTVKEVYGSYRVFVQ